MKEGIFLKEFGIQFCCYSNADGFHIESAKSSDNRFFVFFMLLLYNVNIILKKYAGNDRAGSF